MARTRRRCRAQAAFGDIAPIAMVVTAATMSVAVVTTVPLTTEVTVFDMGGLPRCGEALTDTVIQSRAIGFVVNTTATRVEL